MPTKVTDPAILAQLNGSAPAAPTGGPVFGPAPKPQAPQAPPSGYRWGPAGELTPIPGGPADPAAPESNDPPSGYRWDGAGGLVPIPGGPADKSKPGGSPSDAIAKLTKVIDQIDYLYADSSDNGGWGETGWFGAKLRDQEGTPAFDLGQQVQTVEASSAFDALQKMREASPTGGALGAITERELDLLKSTVANINPNQSQAEFIRSVGVAKGVYLDMLRRIDPAVAEEIESRGYPVRDAEGNITYDERSRDAAPPAVGSTNGAPPPPPSPSGGGNFLGQLGVATQNALAGALQGAAGVYDFPMEVATGVHRGINYGLNRGGNALLQAVGLPGAAQSWSNAASAIDSDLANQSSVADVIESVSPTPEGMGAARFVSQLVGGAAVPIGPKAVARPTAPRPGPAPTASREIIQEGANNNVRVMTSDVRPPRSFVGKTARAIGERIPFAGTGGPRVAQQEERIQAVKDLAREFGADAGTDLLNEVADDLASTRGGQISGLTKQKNAIIERVGGAFQGPRTVAAIDAQISRLSGINAEKFEPVIRELESFRTAITSGKSLQQIEGNRKLLGDLFADPNLAAIKGDGQKALNAIYAPLREDMGDFITANAGDAARTQWAKANDRLSSMAGELGDAVFKGVLRSSDTTPENVARLLFSKKPSEVQRLVRNLSPEGRIKAQGAIIYQAVEKAGGFDAVSPDQFANALQRVGKAAGVVFDGTDLARVQGLQRLLEATKQASVAAAAPPTGVQNTVPILAAVLADFMGTAGGAITAGGAAGGLARLYESGPIRNVLVNLSKTQPGSNAERRYLERIAKLLISQSQIRGAPANDILAASPGRLAAQDEQRN